MEENKFFRLLWRFNAIVISLAGLLTIAVLAFAAISILLETTREREVSNIINVNDNSEVKEEWKLGNLRKIDGTPVVMLSLESDQSYAQSYFSKSARSTRNFLFLNGETGGRKWLFANNDYLIARDSFIYENNSSQKQIIRAILYSIIKQDTNSDRRLNDEDLLTIALTKPSGSQYQEILTGLDRLVGYKLINSDTILIVYEKNGIAYSAQVSLSNFTLSGELALPEVGK